MKNDNNIWVVVGITIVIAIVVSLLTIGITGNVIKVRPSVIGQQVYTKAEVDNMINNATRTSRDLALNSLFNSTLVTGRVSSLTSTCADICTNYGDHNSICTLAFIYGVDSQQDISYAKIQSCGAILGGGYNGGEYACYCSYRN